MNEIKDISAKENNIQDTPFGNALIANINPPRKLTIKSMAIKVTCPFFSSIRIMKCLCVKVKFFKRFFKWYNVKYSLH